MRCPSCGEEGEGRYCAACGTRMARGDEVVCPSCGSPAAADDLYCTECGEPLRERPRKGPRAYVPWVLAALSLVAFSVAIALWVQERSAPREAGAPPTGSVLSGGGGLMEGRDPGSDGGAADDGGAARDGGMPSASELAGMSPREAADRLFNRAMMLADRGGGADSAAFFARMGVRAYRRVPPAEIDPDLRFHVGLLHLVTGDAGAASAQADTILADEPGHLLGLLLAARAAEARGDAGAAERWRDSLGAVAERTDLEARPAYRAHRELIAEAAEGDGG